MPLSPRTSRRLRWAVPVAVAGTVTAATLIPGAASANESPRLPARTAAQLLADLQQSTVSALSGTVVESARLGLPKLPQLAGSAADPLSLLSGSTTLKVWYDGAERQRLALLGQLAEYDAVHSGQDVWTYTSAGNAVTHLRLPREQAGAARPLTGTGAVGDPRAFTTPRAAAEAALAAVDPTTAVAVDRTARVAGRAAYQLVLTPRDPASLVASVRVALDAATSTPLRVQVWGTGDRSTPAFEVGFTDVSFTRPAASVFAFRSPPGAAVKEQQVPAAGGPEQAPTGAASPGTGTSVLGTGWTSVVRVAGVDATALRGGKATEAAGAADTTALLDALTTRVPQGRALQTALLSVLLTDDGRLLAGAVPVSRLQELAR